MTTGPRGSGMLHHDEAHTEALATVPVTLLIPVGDSDPRPLVRDTIRVHGTHDPDAAAITIDVERAAQATAEAVTRILNL